MLDEGGAQPAWQAGHGRLPAARPPRSTPLVVGLVVGLVVDLVVGAPPPRLGLDYIRLSVLMITHKVMPAPNTHAAVRTLPA